MLAHRYRSRVPSQLPCTLGVTTQDSPEGLQSFPRFLLYQANVIWGALLPHSMLALQSRRRVRMEAEPKIQIPPSLPFTRRFLHHLSITLRHHGALRRLDHPRLCQPHPRLCPPRHYFLHGFRHPRATLPLVAPPPCRRRHRHSSPIPSAATTTTTLPGGHRSGARPAHPTASRRPGASAPVTARVPGTG